jgi:hypothetical protein
MGNSILKRQGLMALAAVSGLPAFSQSSRASVIYSQTFSEGTYTGGSSDKLTPPSSPAGLLTYYSGGTPTDFAVLNDADMGNALDFSDSGQKLLSGSLGAITLGNAVGDTLSYSFQFRIPAESGSDNIGFRFGIFNDNGTPVTAPFSSGIAAANDDYGYSAYLGVGTNYLTVYHETNIGSGTLSNDVTDDTRLASTATAPDISDDNAHTAMFTLTEEAGGKVNVAFSVDGTTYFSGLDTNPTPVTSFNDIQFWEHDNLDFRINNIQISATVVPEPVSLGLLSIATSGLLMRRRQRPIF